MRPLVDPGFGDLLFGMFPESKQEELAKLIILEPPTSPVRTVCAVAATMEARYDRAWAGAVVVELPDLRTAVQEKHDHRLTLWQYEPTKMVAAYGPAVVAALKHVRGRPHLLIVSGHGVLHPRGCGLASHIGVVFDVPTIGVADHLLGARTVEPPDVRGAGLYVMRGEERAGGILRTREGAKPVVVSPGHRMDVDTALRWTLALCDRYRLPEPLRMAKALAKRAKAQRV